MSNASSPTPSSIAPAPPSLPNRWLWIAGSGIVAVASLVAAMSASFVTPVNPTVASAVCLMGRLMISAVFLLSGIAKVRAPAFTMGYISSVGLPLAPLGLAIGIGIELVCVPSFLLGYQTRLAAAVLVSYCVATAVFFHRDFHDQDQFTHFFKDLAIAGGLLQIIAFGPGSFSLDAI